MTRTANPDLAGFTRVLVLEPSHPYVGAWWPAGHVLGYEHAFTHQVVDLLTAIAEDRDPEPSFADGLAVQRVLAAVGKALRRTVCGRRSRDDVSAHQGRPIQLRAVDRRLEGRRRLRPGRPSALDPWRPCTTGRVGRGSRHVPRRRRRARRAPGQKRSTGSRRRLRTLAWAWRWSPRTCSGTRCSKMAGSPRTTVPFAGTRRQGAAQPGPCRRPGREYLRTVGRPGGRGVPERPRTWRPRWTATARR